MKNTKGANMKTIILIVIALLLWGLVGYEFGKEGGALDHALGISYEGER